jgi:hypothetical protein
MITEHEPHGRRGSPSENARGLGRSPGSLTEPGRLRVWTRRRRKACEPALDSSVADGSVRETLRSCAELEQLSAEFLEGL